MRLFTALSVASAAVLLLAVSGATDPVIPNDPYFPYQVSFRSVGGTQTIPRFSFRPSPERYDTTPGLDHAIAQAWSITTGSNNVTIALLDDGFSYQHEDIRENVWHNPGETGVDASGHRKETNGIDDDHNGYVDDVMGWDFAFNDPDPDAYIFDGMDRTKIAPNWHSVPAMGIIGAKGNNGIGVAGINWNVSMMLLKIGAQGTPRGEFDHHRCDRAARAIRYAADNGTRVINWSGFVDDRRAGQLAVLRSAIEYAGTRGVLLVLGAGNSMVNIDDDAKCTYPQCFDLPNIINVAEVDFHGRLDQFSGPDRISGSNYGRRRVHIAAIGRNFTTSVQNGLSVYRMVGGTSNAAPVVSGVAALVLAVRPELTAPDIKRILIETATKFPDLDGKIASGGIVDAYQAVRHAQIFQR